MALMPQVGARPSILSLAKTDQQGVKSRLERYKRIAPLAKRPVASCAG